MAIAGLGGVFIKAKDPAALRDWYHATLGLAFGDELSVVLESPPASYSVFGLFEVQSRYFAPSEDRFMINLRVDDLEAMLTDLRAKDVPILGGPETYPQGEFAWIQDPEGLKIELWQPSSSE